MTPPPQPTCPTAQVQKWDHMIQLLPTPWKTLVKTVLAQKILVVPVQHHLFVMLLTRQLGARRGQDVPERTRPP